MSLENEIKSLKEANAELQSQVIQLRLVVDDFEGKQ